MSKFRQEEWGIIEYDSDLDEFESKVYPHADFVIDKPLSAGCLVTGKCNLHCDFCYGNDESLPTEEMTTEQWEKVFRKLRSLGLMRVDISGGEPTIRQDISAIAMAAEDAGLNVVLSTNGLLWYKKETIDLPDNTRIHVSMDSGFEEIHEASRLLRSLNPSKNSFLKTTRFIQKCLDQGFKLRVLTCIGKHNENCLFELGQHLALIGVNEWNISRVLIAGRAQSNYTDKWEVKDEGVLQQISVIRKAYPWMRIRFSTRTKQDGYFLLVLPDGTVATQFTDERDKVAIGNIFAISLQNLKESSIFNLQLHGQKWIAATTDHPAFSIALTA